MIVTTSEANPENPVVDLNVNPLRAVVRLASVPVTVIDAESLEPDVKLNPPSSPMSASHASPSARASQTSPRPRHPSR